MREPVTAIFDIGKTNKKFFLFDRNLHAVHRESVTLSSQHDDDDYPCENLHALTRWIKDVFEEALNDERFRIESLNFSAYGASLVHLDEKGQALPPLYNYTKPLPTEVLESFLEKYGPAHNFALKTGAVPEGMLNSGLQLYWLKYHKPQIFGKIRSSLHLPQYLSYCFSGRAQSEYTSLGCHTGLWDYEGKGYHPWVKNEGMLPLMAPIVPASTTLRVKLSGKDVRVGPGIHDSSASLLPYVQGNAQPFLLVSTGTWSVCLNPKAFELPNPDLLEHNGLYYLQPNGKPVGASRIYLGGEYEQQLNRLAYFYGTSGETHGGVPVNPELYREILESKSPQYYFRNYDGSRPSARKAYPFKTYVDAYHHLMVELVRWQCDNIRFLARDQPVRQLFVDGGFSNNRHYTGLLAYLLPEMDIMVADASMGSAVGAALAISEKALDDEGFKSLFGIYEPETIIFE